MKTFVWEWMRHGVILEFVMMKMDSANDFYYCITVVDELSGFHRFHMQKQSGVWKIAVPDTLPSWIVDLESRLEAAIIKIALQNSP